MLRLVIAEDSAILRAGLAELLTSRGCQVVATVADGEGLEQAVAEHHPDVAVVDVRMPPTRTDEGIRCAIRLRAATPDVGILIFTHHIEPDLAAELLATGTSGVGYLLKERVAAVDDFIAALHRVANGGTALDPELVTELLATRRPGIRDRLTRRELETLELMAQGHSNRRIAELLVVGDRAVEKHVTAIFQKLDIPPSRSENRRVRAVLAYLRDTDPVAGADV